MLTNAPKGTKDMMPEQAYKWHYVEKKFAEICARYGFKEIYEIEEIENIINNTKKHKTIIK